ncbi:MAG: aminotransferase class IV [Actinomycetota bacterium]
MSKYIFINRKFLPEGKAKIDVGDSGFQYGDGLFETMPSLEGKIIALQKHLDRLFSSLAFFGYTLNFSKEDMAAWIASTVQKNNFKKSDAYIKVMVSRGGLGNALSFDTPCKPNVVIISRKLSPYPARYYREGVGVVRSSIARTAFSNPCYRHKLLNYFESIYAKNEARSRGAAEALFLTRDRMVLEGSVSNIFMVKGKNIYTPPLIYNILPGITREAVINIGRKNGLDIKQRKFDFLELGRCDEAFLTNSLMGVMPVRSIEAKELSGAKPGLVTRFLMDLYKSGSQGIQ